MIYQKIIDIMKISVYSIECRFDNTVDYFDCYQNAINLSLSYQTVVSKLGNCSNNEQNINYCTHML